MKIILYILLAIIFTLVIISVVGLFLPKKRILTKQTIYHASIETVYNTVINNRNWQYRTSLEDLKIIKTDGELEIWEEVSAGNVIRFETDKKIPFSFYSFKMDSKLFKGNWFAEFESIEKEETRFTVTESIEYKNPFIRVIAYIFMDLDKFMEIYQNELRYKLENTNT